MAGAPISKSAGGGERSRAGSETGAPAHAFTFTRLQRWPMYGSTWRLLFHTTPVFDRHSTRYRAWWACGLGLAVTALFCWALAVQTRGRMFEAQRATEVKEARDALQAAQKEQIGRAHV